MHEDNTIEIEGATEEEAAQRACDALNTVRENLGYQLLGKDKKRGLMGFMRGGGKKVQIRAWRKDERGEEVSPAPQYAKELLNNILLSICEEFTIEVVENSEAHNLIIESDESGLIIGKNGQTLDALQYIVRRAVSKKFPECEKRLVLDTEGYRERRLESLSLMAKRLAKKVRTSKRSEVLRPMNAYDRRVIHTTLQNETGVVTKSEGEGSHRCVAICPADKRGGRGRDRDRSNQDANEAEVNGNRVESGDADRAGNQQ